MGLEEGKTKVEKRMKGKEHLFRVSLERGRGRRGEGRRMRR
jgi:hypothetical protein